MDFINDKDHISKILNNVCFGLYNCIATSISNKELINYADEFPRYKLNNVIFDINSKNLTFVFDGNITRTISLPEYTVARSTSVPNEFYFNNNSNNDYFVIIFNCK